MEINATEGIVITGISGRFPESDSIAEFKENLFNGVNMVKESDQRWKGNYNMTNKIGKIKDLTRFDASFFGIPPKQAQRLDPQQKLLLEATFEAMLDAGYNPKELKGSNTGVFVGASLAEVADLWSHDMKKLTGYEAVGCAKPMLANRISFTYDLKGPSFVVDTACSSSLCAFHEAVKSLQRGECDSAIVGGANLVLNPTRSLQFHILGMISPDGECRSFDDSANGYIRSEAVVVVLLQKASAARRIYAHVLNSGTNADGLKNDGITYPSGKMQSELIQKVFTEINLNPNKVDYMEAHGTGTKIGDPEEANGIAEILCKDRSKPLLMGSVKSNMGHSEAVSGLCSIVKVLIAMEENRIPQNLHFKTPNSKIPAIIEGKIKIVDSNLNWNGGIVAINSFGFGGTNAHVILESHKQANPLPPANRVPRLVCVSGRTEEAVDSFLSFLEKESQSDDLISLVHKIHETHIPGHDYRGYTVLGTKDKFREISDSAQREIWFIYSGMGAQWVGMGKAYMCLKPFADAMHKCAEVLAKVGIDLMRLINEGVEKDYEDTIINFISLTSIQIALTDLLNALNIKPDYIIGHSAGETACAYADGTLTLEQTVLASYYRGKSVVDANVIEGAMAAIGLSWEEVTPKLPKTVFAVCDNSADSVSVSGPKKDVEDFVEKLQKEGVFARKIANARIPYHSKYVKNAGPLLLDYLKKVIPQPKTISKKWLSTSVPEKDWSTPRATLSSPEYHTNNLVSPVLFRKTVGKIPEGAVVLEVAPHCLLQAIVRRSLPSTSLSIGLCKKGIPDELSNFEANIGKLFIAGLTPDLSVFHKKANFPVAKGTPMIASLIKWDHSQEWDMGKFEETVGSKNKESAVEVNLANEEDEYLLGHTIDGRTLYPATGYIKLIWQAFAEMHGKSLDEFPVCIQNITFEKASILPKEGAITFNINIAKGKGYFVISQGGGVSVTGYISSSEGIDKEGLKLSEEQNNETEHGKGLEKSEIYRDFLLRGYDYSGLFRGIKHSDNYGNKGTLDWNNNWISFMDTVLQFSVIGKNSKELVVPTRILKILIDPKKHLEIVTNREEVAVQSFRDVGAIQSGGVEIVGVKTSIIPKRAPKHTPVLEYSSFMPYEIAKEIMFDDALTAAFDIIRENLVSQTLSIVEAYSEEIQMDLLLAPMMIKISNVIPLLTVEIVLCSPFIDSYKTEIEKLHVEKIKKNISKEVVASEAHMLLTRNIIRDESKFRNALDSIQNGGFIVSIEDSMDEMNWNRESVKMIGKILTERGVILILRKMTSLWEMPSMINITENNFDWVDSIKSALNKSEVTKDKILLVAQKEPQSGILGMVNCIKLERGGENIRCLFLPYETINNVDQSILKKQLEKDLIMNVYMNGQWGSIRHLPIDTSENLFEVEHAYVNTLVRGDLSSLRWIAGPLSIASLHNHPNKEFCYVYNAPLNFKDVMISTGKLPPDALPGNQAELECILGLEFSGRNSMGERVMGTVSCQAMATSVLADPDFLWPIPESWTMEEAATVPVVYTTSYYALVMRGRIKPGESILIHAGAGGVGQASINIAISMGCEVFTTVGSQEKKDFLLNNFPQLKECNIGNSRDTSFEQLIMKRTKGRGVDLILNSLAEEMLQASVRCLAEDGRFLEIGKLDLSNNTPLGMSVFLKNITFHGILLDRVMDMEPGCAEKTELVNLIIRGIDEGVVKPLPYKVYPHNQVEQAFRFVASGKHIGKVMVKVREEESKLRAIRRNQPFTVPSISKSYMHPEKSYIVVGGLGGFGLQLVEWLFFRGAKYVIINSSRGVRTGYQELCIRRWLEKGHNVIVSTEDTTTIEGATKLIELANKFGPVGGIFNLAAVLRDGTMLNQTKENFEIVCKAKIETTRNLDIISRKCCPQLNYFVGFSSYSSGKGNFGQPNYGYANSSVERICEERQAAGYPGVAIQWGAVGDVGMVIDGMNKTNDSVISGLIPQRISSCMSTLDKFLQMPFSVVLSMITEDKGVTSKSNNEVSLIDAIGNILGLKDIKKLSDNVTLGELGLDSLMTAEIKQLLERGYDHIIPTTDIKTLTINKLKELTTGEVKQPTNTDKAAQRLVFDMVGATTENLMPKDTIVKMKAAVEGSDKRITFFLPPISGKIDSLETIANAMGDKDEVWGFQITSEVPLDSIESMADFIIQKMKKIQPKGPYRIMAYSYGSVVSFEIAIQLETKFKDEISLIFLDGSPSYVSSVIKLCENLVGGRSSVENNFFAFYVSLFDSEINFLKLVQDLNSLNDRQKILQHCVDLIKPHVKCSDEEIIQSMFILHKKTLAGENYKAKSKFKGSSTLIKASDSHIGSDLISEISEICEQKITVHEIEGTHHTILVGEKGAKIASIVSEK